MVPFVTDAALFPGSTDLWTSAEKFQFLSLGCGDEEEHAVLLCCWLLSLQIPSCLVLGSALPEGSKAAYVFVNLPDGIYLVNPCDGMARTLSFSPLLCCYCKYAFRICLRIDGCYVSNDFGGNRYYAEKHLWEHSAKFTSQPVAVRSQCEFRSGVCANRIYDLRHFGS
ncbi:unnamed protein product [Heligmosomoides polygyrus]|uniref:CNH domain-containing protein n=1 Tax=Heligmosomoides polygyrus TaxID=6339 RepID=A0A183G2A2_HELPZ|nr:unnamed protein product [Heligmosomoides polygyrus]